MKQPIALDIQLRGLKEQFHSHIVMYHDDIENQVNQAVTDAINAFDFHEEIMRLANRYIYDTVDDAVKRYFRAGDGNEFIYDMVNNILDGVGKK